MAYKKSKLDIIIQYMIPPALVVLMALTITELFYDVGKYYFIIESLDIFIIAIFSIDLYYRWRESASFASFIYRNSLDIIATIPFNYIFLGVEQLVFTRALKGVRIVSRAAKYARYARIFRILRIVGRTPRFLRMRDHLKKTKTRKTQPHEKEMKKVIGFKVILLITINSIMGTGIWFLTSAGVKHAGPASLISWLILSAVSIYIAMCFGELVGMFPKAGGVYEFAKHAYGRFGSFAVGWTTAISGSVTISMLLLGALQYIIPVQFSAWYVPIAIFLVVLFNYIAYKGMRTSTYVLVTFALITILTIVSIIIPGFFHFDTSKLFPFFVFPTANIMLAIFFIAETFFGWESAVFLSAETKNPSKIMPKALIYGTIAIAVFALLLTLTAIGSIPWETYGESSAPLRDLGMAYFGSAGSIIFTLLVFTSIIGAVASWIVTSPRLLMSIAEDKLFFVQFARIHPKHKSPYVSIIFQSFLISLLVIIGSGSYETLLHILVPLILILYSTVLLSVTILRFRKPEISRPFRVPFGKAGPLLTIAFMGFLLVMFIRETHGALNLLRISASLILFGIPAYFAIEIFYNEKYSSLRKAFSASILHHYDRLPFTRAQFNRAINLADLKNRKNQVIVDYDCGVGGFARRILNRKISFGKYYAVERSKEEISVFRKNIPETSENNIEIIYRKSWKIPEKINNIDVFLSYNSIGYIPDISNFLKNLNKRMNPNSKFCFYVKHSIINVTPNALIVEDKKAVEGIFSENGFRASYKKKKMLFSEEIFIFGKKK